MSYTGENAMCFQPRVFNFANILGIQLVNPFIEQNYSKVHAVYTIETAYY